MEKVTSRASFSLDGQRFSDSVVLFQPFSSAFSGKSGMFNCTPLWWVGFWDCDTARACLFVGLNAELKFSLCGRLHRRLPLRTQNISFDFYHAFSPFSE